MLDIYIALTSFLANHAKFRYNLPCVCTLYLHIFMMQVYVLSRLCIHHILPFLHKECKLAGSFLMLFESRTQLFLKNFATTCASEQSQFLSDMFLINVTKAFQPGKTSIIKQSKTIWRLVKYKIIF